MTLTFEPPPPVLMPTVAVGHFLVRRPFCIGRNYAGHAREMGQNPDRDSPLFTARAEAIVPGGSRMRNRPRR